MIIRSLEPEVLEFPFSRLDSTVTPAEIFYVRSHFPTPDLSSSDWKLRVEGAVDNPIELTHQQILQLPSRTVTATLECAGNSRIFVQPPLSGVQWQSGGVGTAQWTGVALADVLALAGVQPHAVEVILEGADSGHVADAPELARTGQIHFARSLTMKKALDPSVLLAYRMNGEQLTPAHGFPLRAIVPGWYAMAAVKWLSRIIVTDAPFNGYFQTIDYAYWKEVDGETVRVPITEIQVKAAIARPEPFEVVRADSDYLITGAAWVGERDLQKVELSTDAGETWHQVELSGEFVPNCWRLWEYRWRTPATRQTVVLKARATDNDGNVQPVEHDVERFGSYMINFVVPITVEVR